MEMWLEFVGVDLQDLPKLCKASKLGATLTRFSGRRFNSEFCQHIIGKLVPSKKLVVVGIAPLALRYIEL